MLEKPSFDLMREYGLQLHYLFVDFPVEERTKERLSIDPDEPPKVFPLSWIARYTVSCDIVQKLVNKHKLSLFARVFFISILVELAEKRRIRRNRMHLTSKHYEALKSLFRVQKALTQQSIEEFEEFRENAKMGIGVKEYMERSRERSEINLRIAREDPRYRAALYLRALKARRSAIFHLKRVAPFVSEKERRIIRSLIPIYLEEERLQMWMIDESLEILDSSQDEE